MCPDGYTMIIRFSRAVQFKSEAFDSLTQNRNPEPKHKIMKTISIPFRASSFRSDYACLDGEVATTENLQMINPLEGSSVIHPGDSSIIPPDGSSTQPFKLKLPPAPEVEFALKRSVLQGWHIHPATFPSQIVEKGEASESGWGKKAMQLLSRFEKDMEKQNLFFEPFLVLSALRMKDGSRVMPSPPVLMIPNSGAPIVSGTDNFAVETMKMDIVAAVCDLQWRVRVTEELKNREDVSGIDILVSETVPLYSGKGDALGQHREECGNFTHSIGSDGVSEERRVSSERIVQSWQPEVSSEAEIMKSILDTVDFYLISEISLDRLKSMEEFEDVDYNCGGLSMMTAYDPYRPDFMHLSQVTAAGSSMISGRMTLWNLTMVSPLPFSLCQTAPYSSVENYNPRWVFHPDPGAKTYRYAVDGEVRELPLRRHPRFYGSYYWSGMDGDVSAATVDAETPSAKSRTVNIPGGVWRSIKENESLFPDSLIMKLDVGRVIAICRAFRASGLVATTSPTVYAFTTEGVFLLKEMDDGTFRDAGLICRHVLRDAGSYIVKGRSVVFATVDGEVMEIDGTTVRSVTGSGATGNSVDKEGIALYPVDTDKRCHMITRPLKLGDAEKLKRVEAVRIRGDFDPGKCKVSLHGSFDLRNWTMIASKRGGGISGLLAPLCRFYRVEVDADLSQGESIQGVSMTLKE